MAWLAMRLLSFLTEIENALVAESPALDGGAWETARMVNFHHGLGRLTLTPRAGNDLPGGAVFVQTFALADGSLCLKASLNWQGANSFPVLAVMPRRGRTGNLKRHALPWPGSKARAKW